MQIECFNPFDANDLYLYPMKASSENFLMFLGGIEKKLAWNVLSYCLTRVCHLASTAPELASKELTDLQETSRHQFAFQKALCILLEAEEKRCYCLMFPFHLLEKKPWYFSPWQAHVPVRIRERGGVGNVRFSNTFKRIKSEQRKNG